MGLNLVQGHYGYDFLYFEISQTGYFLAGFGTQSSFIQYNGEHRHNTQKT